MISQQNTRLPTSNADLHSAAAPVLKPTIDSDGNWITTPASSIDGMDKRVVRAALLTGQLSVSDLMEPATFPDTNKEAHHGPGSR